MADVFTPTTIVYEGIWTDWSRGNVWGLTWTLCPTQAIIVTNALAVFVTISAIRLWTIIRFILSELSASEQPDLTPHLRKKQVILRNAGSDLATAWLMGNLFWSSRRTTNNKKSWSTLGIALFALIFAVTFWIAGVFSNKAISASLPNGSSAVLAQSKQCGILNQTYSDIAKNGLFSTKHEFDLFVQNAAKQKYDMQLSLGYAQECYLTQTSVKSTSMSSACNTFKAPILNWTISYGDSCPFAPQLCHKDSDVIVLDTGLIDSHDHLGINASPKDRLKYQRRTTCAVLDDSGHITGWDGVIVNASSPRPPADTAYANYGPSLYKNTNYTYSYSNFGSFYDQFSAQVTLPYQLDVELAYAPADPPLSLSDFDPISELMQPRADLNLFFLGFTGTYLAPIDDPWFSAHNESHVPNSFDFLESRFSRDAAISTLACTEQHRFCSDNKTCTHFGGFDQVQSNLTFNNSLSPHQNASFDRMLRAITSASMRNIVQNLQGTTTPMLATNVSLGGTSGAVVSTKLPNDQWTLEVNFWHSIAMAQFQRSIVQWATGQAVPYPQYDGIEYLLPPTEEQDKWFCKSLVIQSMVYQSFSFVAMILIVVFGLLIIIVSLAVEELAAVLRKCLKRSVPYRGWDQFDMLSDRTPIHPRFPHRANSSRRQSVRGIGLRLGGTVQETQQAVNQQSRSQQPGSRQSGSRAADFVVDDSPTLPLSDRTIPIITYQPSSSRIVSTQTSQAPPRPKRESWQAISISEFEMMPAVARIPARGNGDERRTLRPPPRLAPIITQPFPKHWRSNTTVKNDTRV